MRWGRAALLPGHRERMGQAAVEMMLLPRLSPSLGHLLPWVKQSAGRVREGPIVRVAGGLASGHTQPAPGRAACGCPCFSRQPGAGTASVGQAASLSRLLTTRCLFFSSTASSYQRRLYKRSPRSRSKPSGSAVHRPTH